MFFALAAMDHRLIPKLHRHALKLAAGGAVYGGRILYQFSGFPRLSFMLPVIFGKQSVSINQPCHSLHPPFHRHTQRGHLP